MWDFPRLLMVVGGVGLMVIGFRKTEMTEVGIGGCFIGSALFGYLAKANDMYAWPQFAFTIAMAVLVVAKLRASRKRHGNAGLQE